MTETKKDEGLEKEINEVIESCYENRFDTEINSELLCDKLQSLIQQRDIERDKKAELRGARELAEKLINISSIDYVEGLEDRVSYVTVIKINKALSELTQEKEDK